MLPTLASVTMKNRAMTRTPSADTGFLSMLSPHLRSADSITAQNTMMATKAMNAQV
ncbi:hypothetical protein D9M69_691200 [compost metagenome]